MPNRRRAVDTAARADAARRRAVLRSDLARLTDLVDGLRRELPARPLDDRELELTGGAVTPVTAEQQLRGIGVLLLTLDTYLRGRRQPPPVTARPSPGSTLSAEAARRNGTPTTAGPAAGLAAAAARYIARDLAARQLSEFTSAEGYRLARELGRIGRDEATVEQLLTQANQIRLHPVSLTEALSHSPH